MLKKTSTMSLPQATDPAITWFRPLAGQWELIDDKINYIDPESEKNILHNYCQYINTTPLDVFRYLIETKGIDLNTLDKKKNYPVEIAIRNFRQNDGDANILIYLLNQSGIDVNEQNKYGRTLVHLCCFYINRLPINIFKYLIEIKGGNINIKDTMNNTPLHIAIRDFKHGDFKILSYFFTHNHIDFSIKGFRDRTVLHSICHNNDKGFDSFLLQSKSIHPDDWFVLVEILVLKFIEQVIEETN
jgi:ankyrin repeat protein